MSRHILPEDRIHPEIREKITQAHRDLVEEVEATLRESEWVVVGMAQNPFVKKARKRLDAAGLSYRYLEIGSYLSLWRRRNALKMWTGWPTFPMVFRGGVLIGGAEELSALLTSEGH